MFLLFLHWNMYYEIAAPLPDVFTEKSYCAIILQESIRFRARKRAVLSKTELL